MTMSLESRGYPTAFTHPALGPSELDATRVAVRWHHGAATDGRAALLDDLGLVTATLDEQRRPALAVNRTDGLWWVRRADGGPVDAGLLDRLEASELVEWAAPGYHAAGAEPASVFAVNPTRLYLHQQALDGIGGVSALPAGLVPDPRPTSRVPGLVVLRVEGRTAIDAVRELAGTLTDHPSGAGSKALVLENIPFLSPTCGGSGCRPPTTEFIPDDPRFGPQWGLKRMRVPRAWEVVRGSPSIVVAVLDEGVELGHPDLALYPQSWNASTDLPDGSPTGNHGTACAGIVAARLGNGLGVAGVAGGVRVLAIATATWADVDVAEGLYFAADNGARVVSMSFGVYPSWGVWNFDLIRDALQYAQDRGLVLVAAAGNENGALARFPGSDARTLCVGGANRGDERKRVGDASGEPWWGASYGPDLDVVAPCLEIPTTDRLGGAGYSADDYFDTFNGTSAATPHVAGLAALILSLRPTLDNVEVRRVIETTCDKISPALYAYANVATKPSGTWHQEVGYGRVDAERAVLAACALGTDEDDGCSGCGGRCQEETPAECRGPAPVPWLPFDRCMYFYESRVFGSERVDVRVTYQHCLRLIGRQQGPLLYTTTLLPGEAVTVYQFDRYRRVREQHERVSVHSSFRQTLSVLSQTRRSSSASAYRDVLAQTRAQADTSVSAGGGLAGFFGAPQTEGESSVVRETSVASGSSVRTVADQFTQNAVTAAQSTEAERSVEVSSFEEAEHREATQRVLRNENHCYAVTYFVRRVMEAYESSTRVEEIEWRVKDDPWRSIDDVGDVPDPVRKALEQLGRVLPRRGSERRDPRPVTLPTDGTLYEAELAHCSSCEPDREAMMRIDVERARLRARRECLETEALDHPHAVQASDDSPGDS
jgi:thermitase